MKTTFTNISILHNGQEVQLKDVSSVDELAAATTEAIKSISENKALRWEKNIKEEYRYVQDHSIDLNNITGPAHDAVLDAIMELDKTFIGSLHYMGEAYFWHSDYKYLLRDVATTEQRKAIHHAFLKHGLPVNSSSTDHKAIITSILG